MPYHILLLKMMKLLRIDRALLLDGLGGFRTLIIAGFGNIIDKVLVIGMNYSHYRKKIYLNSNSIF